MSEQNVTINAGTREQVTLALMKLIDYKFKCQSEEEFLSLYERCRIAVYRTTLK